MPGFYVHYIFAPAIDIAGDMRTGLCVDEEYTSVGSLLFVSTPSHLLSDYTAYWSYGEYAMGPLHQTWRAMGRAADYYSNVRSEVTPSSMRELGGPVFMECYVYAGYDGNLDFYVRTSTTRPMHRFTHYVLEISEPENWWQARHYRLVRRVDCAEWQRMPDHMRR